MTLENVEAFIKANDVATVEAFIAALPPLHKGGFVAVHESFGPEKKFISATHPRIVSWGADSRFIASWTTHPDSPSRDHVEFLQAVPSAGKWIAGVIDFSTDPVGITQPASCAGCHTSMNRPLWGGNIPNREQHLLFRGAEGQGSVGWSAGRKQTESTLKTSTDPRIAVLKFNWISDRGESYRLISGQGKVWDSIPLWEFARTIAMRHGEVVYGNLMLRPDADWARARSICAPAGPRPGHFSQSPALWDPRLFPDGKSAVQGWKPSDMVDNRRYYNGGTGRLTDAVWFLAMHDAYQRFPAAKALYDGKKNDESIRFDNVTWTLGYHYPPGEATAAEEMLATYKEFFGTSGQAYFDQRFRRKHGPRVRGSKLDADYAESALQQHAERFARQVCAVLRPPAPGTLSATAGMVDGKPSVTLTWTDNSPDETGFAVRWRKTGKSSWNDGPAAAAGATSATVAALDFGTNYDFQVAAENHYGRTWSAAASARTPDPPPSGPRRLTVTRTAPSAGPHRASLAWTDPSFAVTGFDIEALEAGDGASWKVLKQVGAGVRSATLTGLPASTGHTFRVVAVDANRRIAGVETLPPPVPAIGGAAVDENEAWASAASLPGGGSDEFRWSLADGDVSAFGIGDDDGVVTMSAKNHEAPEDEDGDNLYDVAVAVADGAGNAAERWIRVRVRDVDEPPEFAASAALAIEVPEGTTGAFGDPVTAVDPEGEKVSYSLAGADAAAFEIDASSARLAVGKDTGLDLETRANYGFEVVATDTGEPVLSASRAVTLTLTNVNEAPAFAASATLPLSVPEGTTGPFGAPVTAVDPDGDKLAYSLTGADAASFEIDASTAQLAVGEDTDLNFEARSSYGFNVVAKDAGALSANRAVTLTLTDIDEAIAIAGLGNGRTPEGRAYASPAPRVTGARGAPAWTLSGPDAGRFAVAQATGALSMAARDHEAPEDADRNNVYEVVLKATDADGVSGAVPFSLTVMNVNEAPSFDPAGELSLEIPERSTGAVGHAVAASDPDGDALTYSLTGADAASFAIDPASGRLSVAAGARLVFEAKSSHGFEAVATDAGAPPLSAARAVRVALTPVPTGGPGPSGGGGEAPPAPTSPTPPRTPTPEPDATTPRRPLQAHFLPDCGEAAVCRVATGERVIFEDRSVGLPTGRAWDFGDGAEAAGRAVAHAWPEPGFYTVTFRVTDGQRDSSDSRTFLVESASPRGTCEPGPFTRCLGHSRFAVRADWSTEDESGRARVVEVGGDESSLFSFFDNDNWELLIKVLDGCAVNQRFWVFGAAATDIDWRIAVTDTRTSTVMVYERQPGGREEALADANAFQGACQRN